MYEPELIDQELERVAVSIGIPPCPGILLDLAAEAKKDEPDFQKVEQLVSRDVGLSATLFKTINSPFYGLRNKICTVKQAISMLGLSILSRTIASLVLRNVFTGRDQVSMERFWDSSAKVAVAASFMARRLPGLNWEEAYTYGLFQNCGIPILMQRFPEYKETLGMANNSSDRRFTEIEDEIHGTDHATIGYLLSKSWNMPEVICLAIRFHHEYSMLSESQTRLSTQSLDLIALGLLADHAVQMHSSMNFSLEWSKGGPHVLAHFDLNETDHNDLFEETLQMLG